MNPGILFWHPKDGRLMLVKVGDHVAVWVSHDLSRHVGRTLDKPNRNFAERHYHTMDAEEWTE